MSCARIDDPRERATRALIALILWVEVLDELVDGVMTASWPTIRDDLGLSYAEIGLLLGVPMIVGNLLEPALSIAADFGWRRRICLAGGVAFGGCCAAVAVADDFTTLLVAMLVMYPASGAFVGLAQLQLVDLDRERSTRQMILWTVAGCVGSLLGPLVLVAAWSGWRGLMAGIAVGFGVAVVALAVAWPSARRGGHRPAAVSDTAPPTLRTGLAAMLRAALRREVLRALVLLMAADLMLDVFASLLGLYFVDVLRCAPATGGAAVLVFVAAMLVGNLVLLPRIGERLESRSLLRATAVGALLGLAALLATASPTLAMIEVAVVGLLVAGWYPVLKAALYDAMPEHGGGALAVHSVSASLFGFVPVGLGVVAASAGIPVAMACLAVGPIVVWVAAPRNAAERG